ncbi:MAG: alcohol dehydrogenase catalytic domain-containing protein, partial [Candidatus Methylomirabilis sp.]|nr:alcohol dehydrogenase catalytic domain-containing protein [Deltaproteobacteria bacterium]
MKAVVIEAHGGPEVLRAKEIPTPKPRAREALVRVRACALNHLDLWVRGGLPHIRPPFPHVLGSDIAGEVAEVGPEVLSFKPGDRVMLQPGVSCGACAECLAGDDHFCRRYEIFGAKRPGGYAEYVAAPEANLIPVPPELDFPEAASIPLVFLTAWHMLVGRAALKARETALIQAAGSGVGSAAVQIAKLLGARVIATAGSEEKLAKARELGADELVNYATGDFAAEARRLTDGRGVDVVFE